MKRSNSFYFIFSMFVAVMFIFASCTKEGPAGPAGKDGVDGEDGIDGTDGTASCIECHDNSQELFAKINQWEHSTHATGGDFERNEGECATCHTSQGFLGNLDGTYDWTADGAMISNPNPPNCYTCHQIHSTYTVADLAFTVTGAVELRNTGGQSFDFGEGSLCASCHQARTVDPFPTEGGADIEVTSPYYGLHHGTQSNTLTGTGYFLIGSGYPAPHPHFDQNTNTCVTCHMAEAYGTQAGGHTWNMTYDYHGQETLNTAGCMTCHTDAGSVVDDFDELETEVDGLMADLKVLLDAKGITADGSDTPIVGTYPAVVAGCFLNYQGLGQDKSHGAHNPSFVKKLLNNSIAALQ